MSRGHAEHDHDSHHGHGGHHHAAPDNWRFLVGMGLNGAFVLIEGLAGVAAHSTALLADAGHNLSDVLSLALAGGAAWLGRRTATSSHRTYGFAKASILAALLNALILVFACGAIVIEVLHRLATPEPVKLGLMMIVAAVGVAINGATALLFMAGRKSDVNVRAAFLHMTTDAGVSAGVIAAGGLIVLTGVLWIDPAVSLLIVAVVLVGTWSLLKESIDLALDSAPRAIDVEEVRAFIQGCPGVTGVHDLHVWALSTTETAMTAHIVRPDGGGDAFLNATRAALADRFGLAHATLQVECRDLSACDELHA
ncbi:MAG TPA: cation diffusion facilitator family transporter [Caulobacteraceae bacterium]|jgi:cobalt-zinc-cadmium efflux system protein|nr:cation diffusion facilitator family transporter [Caulobacteraceae bacterium]